MKAVYVFIILIVGEAIYEGLANRGHKKVGGAIESVIRGFGLAIMIVLYGCRLNTEPWWADLALSYLFIRGAVFGPIYGIVSIGDPYYVGTTKLYDKMLNWIFYKSIIKAPKGPFIQTLFIMGTILGIWMGLTYPIHTILNWY